MMELKTTAQFRRDYKRLKKRGMNMEKLQKVIDALLAERQLERKQRDHALSGDYIGFRECHIEPDWLLIYMKEEEKLILTAVRTGTHSDLFDM